MADGNGPGRWTVSGIAFGVLLLILIVVSLWLFIAKPYWFPTLVSVHGAEIDSVFSAVLIICGIAFVAVQAALGLFCGALWFERKRTRRVLARQSQSRSLSADCDGGDFDRARVHGPARLGESIYFSERPRTPRSSEVTGQQFNLDLPLSRPGRQLGRQDTALITSTNDLGLDRNDPSQRMISFH